MNKLTYTHWQQLCALLATTADRLEEMGKEEDAESFVSALDVAMDYRNRTNGDGSLKS